MCRILLLFTLVVICLLVIPSVEAYTERRLFSLDARFRSELDLDSGAISEDLRREFKEYEYGIWLSENASVSIEEPGKRWLITDKYNNEIYDYKHEMRRRYLIKERGGYLNVYFQLAPLDLVICVDVSKSLDKEELHKVLGYIIDYEYKFGASGDRVLLLTFGEKGGEECYFPEKKSGGIMRLAKLTNGNIGALDDASKNIKNNTWVDVDTDFTSLIDRLKPDLKRFYKDGKNTDYNARRLLIIISDGVHDSPPSEYPAAKSLCMKLRSDKIKLDMQIVLFRVTYTEKDTDKKETSDKFWDQEETKKWAKVFKVSDLMENSIIPYEGIAEQDALKFNIYKILDDSRHPRRIYIELLSHSDSPSGDPIVMMFCEDNVAKLDLFCRSTYERNFEIDYKAKLGISAASGAVLEPNDSLEIPGKGEQGYLGKQSYLGTYRVSKVREKPVTPDFRPVGCTIDDIPENPFVKLTAAIDGHSEYNLEIDGTKKLLQKSSGDQGVDVKKPYLVFTWKDSVELEFEPYITKSPGYTLETLLLEVEDVNVYENKKPEKYDCDLKPNIKDKWQSSVFSKPFKVRISDNGGIRSIKLGVIKVDFVYVYWIRLLLAFIWLVISTRGLYLILDLILRKFEWKTPELIMFLCESVIYIVMAGILFIPPQIKFSTLFALCPTLILVINISNNFLLYAQRHAGFREFGDRPNKWYWLVFMGPPLLFLGLVTFRIVLYEFNSIVIVLLILLLVVAIIFIVKLAKISKPFAEDKSSDLKKGN